MRFNDCIEEGVLVFEITGKILGGGGETTLFHGKVHEYMGRNHKNVVVDLAGVEWMNAIGLGMLISAMTTVKSAGGRFVLCNISSIRSILDITRLIRVFDCYDIKQENAAANREEAIRSFSKGVAT
jgi:anti-sigma B factor antagonist